MYSFMHRKLFKLFDDKLLNQISLLQNLKFNKKINKIKLIKNNYFFFIRNNFVSL